MTIRFETQKPCAEKGLFHAYFRPHIEVYQPTRPGGGKRLVSCLFPHSTPPPKALRKKATYYVREKGGTFQWPPFSPHIVSKTAAPHRELKMDRIEITLPYPPTVNHYWETRVVRKGTRYVPSVYVSDKGRRYQESVRRVLDGAPKLLGPVRVQILVRPPDQRLRDLDNILKCLLDSLTKAGVWDDDSQVASLLVVRGDQADGGAVLMIVEEVI